MIKVLFVCMGNICRSPMAEAVFMDLVQKAGLIDHFKIDSAGTIRSHAGEAAHRGTRQILKEHNIPYKGRARQLTSADMESFDYIIAMDTENVMDIAPFDPDGIGRPKVRKLLDFATETAVRDVPDPYYAGNFDDVYQLVLDGCRGLLAQILEEHHLS